jgi:hypothetical protein
MTAVAGLDPAIHPFLKMDARIIPDHVRDTAHDGG